MDIAILKPVNPFNFNDPDIAAIPIFDRFLVKGDKLQGFGWSCWVAGTVVCFFAPLTIPTKLRCADMNVIDYKKQSCGQPVNGSTYCTYSDPLHLFSTDGGPCNVSLFLSNVLNS